MSETQLKAQYKSALAELRKVLDREHQSLLLPAERYTGELRREKATLIRKCDELEAAKRRLTTEVAELPGLRSMAAELDQVRSEKDKLQHRLQSIMSLLNYDRPRALQSGCCSEAWELSNDTNLLVLARNCQLVLWDMAVVCFPSEEIARAFIQRCLRPTLRQAIELHAINGSVAIVEFCRVAHETQGCRQMRVVVDIKDGGVGYAAVDIASLLRIHDKHEDGCIASDEENNYDAA